MVTERTKLTLEERKKLHTKLARGARVVEKVAEARADYEKVIGDLAKKQKKLSKPDKGVSLSLAGRKKLHAKLARDPALPAKIDQAMADYEEALAKGELRRTSTTGGNGRTRQNAP